MKKPEEIYSKIKELEEGRDKLSKLSKEAADKKNREIYTQTRKDLERHISTLEWVLR